MPTHRYVMSQPPLAVGAAAAYPFSPRLAERFTAVTRFGESYPLYRRAGAHLLLPRALCPPPAAAANDHRAAGQPVAFQAAAFAPRNADQARWVAESIAFLAAGQCGISQAFTGFGKTACAMPVIAALGRKTLVVCTKEDLMLGEGQWLGALRRFLGLADRDIGIVRQDRCDVAGKKVVLGLVQSLSLAGRYPPGTFDDFGLVVWDETHRVAADTFSNTAFLFPAKLRWGLSATPERKDGREAVVFAHIGPVRVRSAAPANPPKVLHFTSSWRCPRIVRAGAVVRLPHAPARLGRVLASLAADEARNDLLGRAVQMAYARRHNVVVFTELLEHIALLRLTLGSLGVPWGDVGVYVGGLSARARDAASVKPIVLTTWRMTSEGTNCPWWSCAVFATPRADVEQATGRVLRAYPDKPRPLVIDIADLDSPVLAAYARARRAWYRSVGAEQVAL